MYGDVLAYSDTHTAILAMLACRVIYANTLFQFVTYVVVFGEYIFHRAVRVKEEGWLDVRCYYYIILHAQEVRTCTHFADR